MIQDIAPHKLNNQYDPKLTPNESDPVLSFDGSKVLLKDDSTFPKISDFEKGKAFVYLFALDDLHFFRPDGWIQVPDGCSWMEVFQLRRERKLSKPLTFAALTGKHLADWYRDTRFCGRCGSPMTHSTKERAMVCPNCRNTVYPRIMPAVIVGVTNGDQLLLTKYRVGFNQNALIAGFTEIGETLEETVSREVMEEAGIRVKNIRYYKSQPWGMPNDILAGFFCEVDGDTQIRMDSQELKYAAWVKREDIELQSDDFSLTNEMMMIFKNNQMPY